MKIEAARPEEFRWLKEKTGCALTDDFNAIKAVDASGRIRGMTGYCNWTPNSVVIHIAVETPIIWRHLVGPGLVYPFEQVGVGIVLGIIPAGNLPSRRFAKAVGFQEVYRIPDAAMPGEDIVIMQLQREAWQAARPLERRAA